MVSRSSADVKMTEPDREHRVRIFLTIIGAAAGLGSGIFGSVSFLNSSPYELLLADKFYVCVPSVLAFTAASALAGRWLANRILACKPSLLLSPLLGAGLGAIACAFVGGVGFPVLVTLATSPRIGISSGSVQGLATFGLGLLAGTFWGGITGLPVGTVTAPVVSFYMSF